ncbi:MAG: hypothetical protein RMK89_13515 [Armatimonadota bacterium]|nr:hypothetical protein [Armatimonadota bacterium]MDW8144467.1 hypothetical protein [Armatimonadota bacterium]
MNLRLVIRQPWELGYGIKRIVDDADFEVPLSQAGWVGEMRLNLPRPDFDFVRLGDEIEVYNDKEQLLWGGKVVHVRYDKSNVAQITAKGLCEFAYDLPVDSLWGAQGVSWSPQVLWTRACNVARQHWSRLVAEAETINNPTIPEPIDFRFRTLGDVWRMLIQMNADVVVKPSLETVKSIPNRLMLKLALRSATPIRIHRDELGDWELEYDSRQVQNRMLVTYKNEQPSNMLPEFSFEDATSVAWERTGSGSGWAVELWQAHYGAIAPWCSHNSMLYISIPNQSPAGSVEIRTKDKINFGESTKTFVIGVWVNGSGLGEVFEIYIGTTRILQMTLPYGWTFITQSFNASGQHQVRFRVIGITTSHVIVYLDHALLVQTSSLSLAPPLLVGSAETRKLATMLTNDMAARVLRSSVYSGSVWQVYAPTGLAWTSDLVGQKVEMWRFGSDKHVSERVVGTITQVVDNNTIRVNITENPTSSSAGSFVGGCIRLLESGEAFFGVKYQTLVVANNSEAVAMLKALSKPVITLRATVHERERIIPVDGELIIPEFFDVQESFPVVSNTLVVRAGELIAQKIEAGSQELTLRGFMRKIQKQMTEYVQTR